MNNELWNKGKALMYHAIRSMYLQLLNTKLWVLSLLQIQVDDQHFGLILGKAVIILGFRLFSFSYSDTTVMSRNMSHLFNFLVTTVLFVSLNHNNLRKTL